VEEKFKLSNIPSKEQILAKAYKAYIKASSMKVKSLEDQRKLELRRLDAVYTCVKDKLLQVIKALPEIENLHPFYRELIDLLVGVDNVKKALSEISKSRRIIHSLWRNYRRQIINANEAREMRRYRREGIGRILSIVKRRGKYVEFLREAVIKLRKVPDIDPNLKTIIIAGMPQTGKSTLTNILSTAKSKVAPYPFTTKFIIVGHFEYQGSKFQVIDTPGLLDRPLGERNKIELQAILALRNLRGVIVYLFDVSKSSYYTLNEQVNVLKDIIENFGDKPIVPVVNKIDIAEEDDVKRIEDVVKRLGLKNLFKISALKDYGVDELKEYILKLL